MNENLCSRCGSQQILMLFSYVCKAECDKRTEVKIDTVVAAGSYLWVAKDLCQLRSSAPPPEGWTYCCWSSDDVTKPLHDLQKLKDNLAIKAPLPEIGTAFVERSALEKLAKSYGAGSGAQHLRDGTFSINKDPHSVQTYPMYFVPKNH